MRIHKNNKGMAMVTVLIAITFIGILAASMMYMSYMNYIAKSVRYSSTDNFYTTEYGLADLSTALQNRAANASSISTAMSRFTTEDITTAKGVSQILRTNPNNNTIKCYDCYALEELIQSASKEANIEVFTTYDTDGDRWAETDNYILDSKSITFLGVKIRSTTADGFVTTINTDIKITFDNNPGDMSVNDFSVITDSPIIMDNKDVIVGGNLFVGNRDDSAPGGVAENALTLKNISIMTLLSKKGIIHGNVLIEEGSTLVITGNITVYGKITINKGGTLICTGDLVHSDIIDAKAGSILKGIQESHPAKPDLAGIGVDGNGDGVEDSFLASAILSTVYVKNTSGTEWKEMSLKQFQQSNGGLPNPYKQYKDQSNTISTWCGVIHPMNDGDIQDALILNAYQNVEIRGDARNSTIISTLPVTYFGDHKTTYMQCMTDENYDKARNILINGGGQINGLDGGNYSFHGGDLGSTVTFPLSDATDAKIITMPDPPNGIEGRTVYFKGNENYVPTGYFIAENADAILSQAFAATQGDADPKNSTISYMNWNKE